MVARAAVQTNALIRQTESAANKPNKKFLLYRYQALGPVCSNSSGVRSWSAGPRGASGGR